MHTVLVEIVVVMAASVVAALLLRRLRLPPVVGFLIAGIIVGPGGIGLVRDRHVIEGVAEIGVMLLLFMVGLKISLRDLWRMRGIVLGGGALQYGVTSTAVAGIALGLGLLGLLDHHDVFGGQLEGRPAHIGDGADGVGG